jgi:hypothetical protein
VLLNADRSLAFFLKCPSGANFQVYLFINVEKGIHSLQLKRILVQTMTALMKSFCGGSRGAVFSKSAPLAAGGKKALAGLFFVLIRGHAGIFFKGFIESGS